MLWGISKGGRLVYDFILSCYISQKWNFIIFFFTLDLVEKLVGVFALLEKKLHSSLYHQWNFEMTLTVFSFFFFINIIERLLPQREKGKVDSSINKSTLIHKHSIEVDTFIFATKLLFYWHDKTLTSLSYKDTSLIIQLYMFL